MDSYMIDQIKRLKERAAEASEKAQRQIDLFIEGDNYIYINGKTPDILNHCHNKAAEIKERLTRLIEI